MKNNFLILSFSFVLLSYYSFATDKWTETSLINSHPIRHITAIDNQKALAVGDNGIAFLSNNKGADWNTINLNTSSHLLYSLYHDATLFVCSANGNLFKSTNQGDTWTILNLGNTALNSIDFLGENGITVGSNGEVWVSDDNGNKWISAGAQSIYALNAVKMINDTLAICVGANGVIKKSTNNGGNWLNIQSNTTNQLSAIDYLSNELKIFITGTNGTSLYFSLDNELVKNIQLGNDWLRSIHCLADRCYLAGFNGSVQRYQDQNFVSLNTSNTINTTSILFFNTQDGLIGTSSGKIYRTNNGGVFTATINHSTIKVYPNPCINQLFFELAPKNTQIQISDLQGKVYINQELKKSQINVNQLNKGVYVVSLFNLNGALIHQHKMIKH